MPPQPSPPTLAAYPSENLTLSAGIAIFHLASARVVLCYHTREKYWFLPKGRLNVNEDSRAAAEREGFEETGYRNRVLPLPLRHRQTQSEEEEEEERFVTVPVWVQLLPLSARSQYLLFWYVGETVSADEERGRCLVQGAENGKTVYVAPTSFPKGMTLQERIEEDFVVREDGSREVYEPVWHEGTGVNEDELCYKSYLLPWQEACKKLRGSVMEDVVRKGWEGIQLRIEMEKRLGKSSASAVDNQGSKRWKKEGRCN